MKTVCVTGHRPKGFPWEYGRKNLQQLLYIGRMTESVRMLIATGHSHFISGGAIGVDLDFAEIVLKLRKLSPITLEIAVPCDKQDLKWSDADKARYEKVLKQADKITQVSNHYTPSCMQKRNEYMVDKSDLVLAVWNEENKGGTYNTIGYAKKAGKPINFIYLQDI